MGSTEEFKLGELVYAEIKKAFSVCDADGNGYLDINELRAVMKSIMEKEPTDLELTQFMNLVDADKSGTVCFQEFLTAITTWLTDDKEPVKDDPASRKRKLVDSERHEVHKKIKSFFMQFEQSTQFDDIRRRMHSVGFNDVMELDANIQSHTSAFKLEFLKNYRLALQTNVDSITLGLKGGQIEFLVPAVRHLNDLLRIVEIFSTPAERRSVADDVLRVFSLVINHGFVEPLVKCLHLQHTELQLLALNSLRLIAPGPSIASTPPDHVLHPDKMLFKRMIFTHNPFAVVVAFLNGNHPKLCEDALAFVTTFSQNHPECRDVMLQHGALPPVLSLASLSQRQQQYLPPSTPNTESELSKIARALAVLLGVTHPVTKLPPWALISTALPVIGSLLFSNDHNVLLPILAAASFLLPGVPEISVCRRLVELLHHLLPRVQKAALKAIDGIIKYDRQQTAVLVDQCGLIPVLTTMLASQDLALRSTSCNTVALLAQHFPEALAHAGTLQLVLSLMHTDDLLRAQLVHVVKAFVSGRQAHVEHLIGKDAIKSLCKAFSYFKSYDEVLVTEYKFTGATFSFDLVDDIVSILETILNTGEAITASMQHNPNAINAYALVFDLECIDKIRSLLDTMRTSMQKYGKLVDAWREKGINKPAHNTEECLKYVLYVVSKAHKTRLDVTKIEEEKRSSKLVVDMIKEIEKDFFSGSGEHNQSRKVLLKCNYNGDMRIISTDSDISYTQLKSLLEEKYEISRASLAYVDEEKDTITVDSSESLHKAFAKYKIDGYRALKVNITITPPTPHLNRKASTGLSSPQTPSSPFPSSKSNHLAALLTPLDLDAISMDLQNLEVIRAQERKVLLESLATTTHFGLKELEAMFGNWANQAPQGYLTRNQFESGLAEVGLRDPLVIESYWHAFDINHDGKVNFRHFVTSLGILKRGNLEEKLLFAFRAFDKDNSGFIEKHELTEMVRAGMTAQNRVMTAQELHQAVEECFRVMDVNKDGRLSFDEFSHAIMLQPVLVKLFVPAIPGLLA